MTYYTITIHVVDSSFPELPSDLLEYYNTLVGLTGEVTIKIYATGATGNQQMVIDNFIWVE